MKIVASSQLPVKKKWFSIDYHDLYFHLSLCRDGMIINILKFYSKSIRLSIKMREEKTEDRKGKTAIFF
jgi:hypothetical protein